MKNKYDPDFTLKILQLVCHHDIYDDIYWNTTGEFAPVTFFFKCSDFFDWGSADAEEITPENIKLLPKAIEDAMAVGDKCGLYWTLLWAARVRQQRPMSEAYPKEPDLKGLWALFDACGPERKKDE